MVKKLMENTVNHENRRTGYTKYSVPSRLNIKSSFEQSLARQISLKGAFEKKLEILRASLANARESNAKRELEVEIEKVAKQAKTIPFFEDVDLRYNNFEHVPIPVTSA